MRVSKGHLPVVALAFCVVTGLGGARAVSQEADADHTVLLSNIEFVPRRLRVAKGETIQFVNRDKFKHDVYLVRAANRNVVILPATGIPAGESVTVTINQEGLFNLYCTIHGGMRGRISTTDTFELSAEEREKFAKLHVMPPIVKTGEALFWGRAQCHRCHRMGDRGGRIREAVTAQCHACHPAGQLASLGEPLRGPNLQDIGFRAAPRAKKLGLESATAYITQSILKPSAYIVEGYSNDMPKVYQPPIRMNEQELQALVAYLQSQGGEVDTWSININASQVATEPTMNPFRNGDPVRGATVFRETGCNSCHTIAQQKAISVGPDLTAIGAYRNWTWLAESIIEPNAERGAHWKDAVVYPESGPPLSGVLREDAPTHVTLLVAPGRTVTVARDQIEQMTISELSRMPADIIDTLSFRQVADLIAYLTSLRDPVPRAR